VLNADRDPDRRCYVDDLVDGLMRLMATPGEVIGPMNLGNPVEFTIGQLAELVVALTGSSSKIVYRPLPSDDPKQRCPDIGFAQQHLGWSPKVELRQGLAKTVAYFEQLLRRQGPQTCPKRIDKVAPGSYQPNAFNRSEDPQEQA